MLSHHQQTKFLSCWFCLICYNFVLDITCPILFVFQICSIWVCVSLRCKVYVYTCVCTHIFQGNCGSLQIFCTFSYFFLPVWYISQMNMSSQGTIYWHIDFLIVPLFYISLICLLYLFIYCFFYLFDAISLFLFFSLTFWPHCTTCGILVPGPGIEPAAPAVEAQSLNRCTTREVPISLFLCFTHTV